MHRHQRVDSATDVSQLLICNLDRGVNLLRATEIKGTHRDQQGSIRSHTQ